MIFASFSAKGQVDSVYESLKNLKGIKKVEPLLNEAHKMLLNNPSRSSEYIREVIDILSRIENDSLKGEAYSLSGKAQYYTANYDSALNDWKYALETFQKIKYDKGIAEQYNNLGVWYYSAASDYDAALNYHLLSLKKKEEIADTAGMAYSLSNIGSIYSKQNRNDKAIEHFKIGLEYAVKSNDLKISSILLNNLGVEYEQTEKYDISLDYYLRSAEIKKELNHTKSLALTYLNIGSIYKNLENYDRALEYYENSNKLLSKESDRYYKALIYNYIATIHKRKSEFQKAMYELNQSIQLAEEINDRNLLKENYEELHKVYFLIGNYKEAYIFQRKYLELHDSLFNEESDARMKEMEVKFETDKKIRENELLKRQQQINELEIEKKTNRQYYLLAGSVILLLFLILIYGRYRLKKKTNIVLEETNLKLTNSEQKLKESIATKDKFFSIIAHDLRNPLSSLSLVSQVLDENSHELPEEKLKYYIGSIHKAANGLMDLVENLLNWARTQTNKIDINFEKLDIYKLINQNIALLKFSAEKKNINMLNTVPEKTVVFADINLLTTVIRNLLANAVKFTTENGNITISSVNYENELEIRIQDTGIGMSKEDLAKIFRIDVDTSSIGNSTEKGTGLGLILCKEFIELNRGIIRAESVEGEGSTFIIRIPRI
jgi:signal transduction histidine kinase